MVAEPMPPVDGIEPRNPPDGQAAHATRLEAIYRSEAPRLTRLLRARVACCDDPRDLVQDAFARIAACLPATALRRPEAYLNHIVRNLLVDRSRRHAREPRLFCVSEENDLAVAPDQAHAIEVEDLRSCYRAAVAKLPPRTRQIFLLKRADEMDNRSIAENLGISVRTVEWHMAQALMQLDKALR